MADIISNKKKSFKLSKSDCLDLFERILLAIKKQKVGYFTLAKLKGDLEGYCDWDDGITIDYRKEFIATLIHEMIHLIEPDWVETKVIYAESKVMNLISEDDVICLLKIFIKKL